MILFSSLWLSRGFAKFPKKTNLLIEVFPFRGLLIGMGFDYFKERRSLFAVQEGERGMRQLWVSPGHPTADGRVVDQLRSGTVYDGATIRIANLERYDQGRTFDLLLAGDTGFYWANGILLASTLR